MSQQKITPSFTGDDAEAVHTLVTLVRESSKVPNLSIAQAIMIAVREKLAKETN